MKFTQAKILIDCIKDSRYRLNEWELGFICDLSERKKDLSDRQYSCLQRIYDKSTGFCDYQPKQWI